MAGSSTSRPENAPATASTVSSASRRWSGMEPFMSLSEATLTRSQDATAMNDRGLRELAAQLVAALNARIDAGQAGAVPDEALQQLMTTLVKVYAAKFDEGQRPTLLAADGGVSATAVLVTTSALMKASNLEIFELGMWQSWSGTR